MSHHDTRHTARATTVLDPDLPPHGLLWELATISTIGRCLYAVAQHGVADAVPEEGTTVQELATTLGLDPDALGRMLRALAQYGVFDVDLPDVRHSPASSLLCTDHPMSMGPFAHMMGLPLSWDAVTSLPTTLRTGRAGIFDLDEQGLFSYLAHHPDQAEIFDRAMTAKSHADIPLILQAFDFERHHHVVDLGGGRGHLLRALRERCPSVDATLVDLPDVIARQDDGVGRPFELVAADFFIDDLPAADVYVLMEIIHDWDDADAVRILSNVRRSAPPDSTVLIVETVLQDGAGRDPAKTLDIVMLAVTGGRERTPAEYAALLQSTGFEFCRVIRTPGGVQIVEATAVDRSRA